MGFNSGFKGLKRTEREPTKHSCKCHGQ